VGFRTPKGQLTTTQSFKTIQIPRQVRGKPGAWDPSICLDWGHRFLSFLKSTIASHSSANSPRSVWRVTFTPGDGVTAAPLDQAGIDEVEAGEDRVGFLPRWYADELRVPPAEGVQDSGCTAGPEDATDRAQTGADGHQSSGVADEVVPGGRKI
jgi:hypothetical protein